MIKTRPTYESNGFRIFLGFAASMTFLCAITHPQISYLILLAISAFWKDSSFKSIQHFVRRFHPIKLTATIAGLATIANFFFPAPVFAQWQGAKSAADTSLGPYIGADVVTLLFTIVFLLLFFLIIGGLMTWGYKAFRNEDAAVPMTAFIVGTVIFVGGEVFSSLFFSGGLGTGAGAGAGTP
ncbi:MAG: hypothetical protein ABG776_00630 [Cyanobacteria bacterium J06555_13]